MIIVPIGHDKLYRRLPYLTIVLIGLNVIVWLISFPIEIKQRTHINEFYMELYLKESDLYDEYLRENPDAERYPVVKNFRKAIEEGEIFDKESEEYKEWEELYVKFKKPLESRVFYRFGFKPKHISIFNLISSLFLHASLFHLFFNMLFLWLVGVNIEDYWGRPLFISLFLFGGIFASLFYALFHMGSNIPLIGASGAISALMGAFAVRFYKTKIRFFYFFFVIIRPFIGTFKLYAWFALGFWFAEQLFYALVTKGLDAGVAFLAHVGGFVFGLAAGFAMKFFKVEEKYLSGKIEGQIETVELHPKLEEAFNKRDVGDTEGAVILLKEILEEDPSNSDARLELARCLIILEKKNEATIEYERILTLLYEKGEMNELYNVYLEIYDKDIDYLFSPKIQFRIGTYLTSREEYGKAVELFSLLVKHHSEDRLAPAALLKTGRIFLTKLEDKPLGKGALELLINKYPNYIGISEAKKLLSDYKD